MNYITLLFFVALPMIPGSEPESWEAWAAKGEALKRVQDQAGAMEAFRRATHLAEPGKNIKAMEYVNILNAMALLYLDQGEYAQAEYAWRQGAAVLEKWEGKNSLNYALLFANQVTLPTYHGNTKEAVTFLREAVNRYRGASSEIEITLMRWSLVKELMEQGHYGEAEAELQEARVDLERHGNKNPEQLAYILRTLGFIRFREGRFTEAFDMHHEELRLLETVFHRERGELAPSLNDIAACLAKLGRTQEASDLYRRAVKICERAGEENDTVCGPLFKSYAVVLRTLGRKKDSREMAARGARMEESVHRRNGIGLSVNVSALLNERP